MKMQPITIRVDEEVARIFKSASAQQKLRIEALLSLKLAEIYEFESSDTSFEQTADQASRKAAERGLTPEIFASILNE